MTLEIKLNKGATDIEFSNEQLIRYVEYTLGLTYLMKEDNPLYKNPDILELIVDSIIVK